MSTKFSVMSGNILTSFPDCLLKTKLDIQLLYLIKNMILLKHNKYQSAECTNLCTIFQAITIHL